ncbi:MAG TPA: hypothetical protein PKY82_21170 [Pyrinomonadaceae bacterium]|nr:hypothetical protein [Pyrinomonadaceae bacterium]
MIKQCLNCGFNINELDDVCLYCGISKPLIKIPDQDIILAIVIVAAFFIWLSVSFILSTLGSLLQSKIVSSIVVFLILGFIPLVVFESYKYIKKKRRESSNRVVIEGLSQKQNLIKQRFQELSNKQSSIDEVLHGIGPKPNQDLNDTYKKLHYAKVLIRDQIIRYELQNKKIKLIRFQNMLLPVLSVDQGLDEMQIRLGIRNIDRAIYEIYLIQKSLYLDNPTETALERDQLWADLPTNTQPEFHDKMNFLRWQMDMDRAHASNKNKKSHEYPTDIISGRKDFAIQLECAYNCIQRLRDSLLKAQATLALQGIPPTAIQPSNIISSDDFYQLIEIFNIEIDLVDFSQTFQELEHEYHRLRATSDLI